MSCFSQKFYLYSSNFKPCKLVKTQFQSIVFLSPPNSAAKNTWSLYLIELLIRGQIDQLGFAFFLFSAFLTCTRVNVDCMFPDEGGLNCVSTMTQVSKFCPRIMKPFFLLEVLMWTQLCGGLFSPRAKWKKKCPRFVFVFAIQKIKGGLWSLNNPIVSKFLIKKII